MRLTLADGRWMCSAPPAVRLGFGVPSQWRDTDVCAALSLAAHLRAAIAPLCYTSLASVHNNAFSTAVAAEAASDQGKFWQMRNLLVALSGKYSPQIESQLIEDLRLDSKRFKDSSKSGAKQAVKSEVADAEYLQLPGTAAFYFERQTVVSCF
jgi:hypothetical protein